MQNQESKKYKLLRTGGDCEGGFTEFRFLHGKKEKKIISKQLIYINVCVASSKSRKTQKTTNHTNNRFLCIKNVFYS